MVEGASLMNENMLTISMQLMMVPGSVQNSFYLQVIFLSLFIYSFILFVFFLFYFFITDYWSHLVLPFCAGLMGGEPYYPNSSHSAQN